MFNWASHAVHSVFKNYAFVFLDKPCIISFDQWVDIEVVSWISKLHYQVQGDVVTFLFIILIILDKSSVHETVRKAFHLCNIHPCETWIKDKTLILELDCVFPYWLKEFFFVALRLFLNVDWVWMVLIFKEIVHIVWSLNNERHCFKLERIADVDFF